MTYPARHVADLSAYALADLIAPKGKRLVSLSQNESLRPPSPLAVKAAARAVTDAHLYPDPDWNALRLALSSPHGLCKETILCGNGSMELISALTCSFADETGSVLAPCHAYPFFGTAARLSRARFDVAPERDMTVSVDNLLGAIQRDTRIVFVANPGNPTGTRISRDEVIRLRDGMPTKTLLVIDEAYGEFADHLNEPVFDLVQRGNTVVLRTMSKAYGLAGMRVGWGVFPSDIAHQMRKVLNPNSVSVANQAAALAAVEDQSYMRETCKMTARLRDAFARRLHRSGFFVADSYTNFVLIRFASSKAALGANQTLRNEGVFMRAQGAAGLNEHLRATIGAKEDMDLAASILERWKERATV